MTDHTLGLTFITRCFESADGARMPEDFQGAVEPFGFTGAFCAASITAGRRRFDRLMFSTWPQELLDLLLHGQLFEGDRLLDEARRRLTPFTWTEALHHQSSTPTAAPHPALRDHGWTDGLMIPIHGPFGYQGLIGLASRRHVAPSSADRALLHVMAVAAHERCRAQASAAAPRLTRREFECLRWVAAGKSDRAIAGLLGVSEATAHYHVEQAKKKLGVGSRSLAVAMLVLRGDL